MPDYRRRLTHLWLKAHQSGGHSRPAMRRLAAPSSGAATVDPGAGPEAPASPSGRADRPWVATVDPTGFALVTRYSDE